MPALTEARCWCSAPTLSTTLTSSRSGAGQLTGTAAQFPFLMGQRSKVEACLAALAGRAIDPLTVAPQALITSENVVDGQRCLAAAFRVRV